MSELTDLEICEAIAKIDGVEAFEFKGVLILKGRFNEAVNDFHGDMRPFDINKCKGIYNPLTDDALNHRLMIKYKVKIIYEDNPDYYHAFVTIPMMKNGYSDENANKAILMAIIEANKDKL